MNHSLVPRSQCGELSDKLMWNRWGVDMEETQLVLVTGATGYIGGRLVPRLLEAGYRVRCLARDARRLEGRPWSEQVEVVEGDATRPETLPSQWRACGLPTISSTA